MKKMGAKNAKLLNFLDNPQDREAINQAFATYDKDKSGEIDRDEFQLFINNVVEYFIQKHPDTPATDLAVLPDAENIKVKDMDEEMKERVAQILATSMFEVMDTNKDQKISLEEWKSTEWKTLTHRVKGVLKRTTTSVANSMKGRWIFTVGATKANEEFSWTGRIQVVNERTIKGKIKSFPLKNNSCVAGNLLTLVAEGEGGRKISVALEGDFSGFRPEPDKKGIVKYKVHGPLREVVPSRRFPSFTIKVSGVLHTIPPGQEEDD